MSLLHPFPAPPPSGLIIPSSTPISTFLYRATNNRPTCGQTWFHSETTPPITAFVSPTCPECNIALMRFKARDVGFVILNGKGEVRDEGGAGVTKRRGKRRWRRADGEENEATVNDAEVVERTGVIESVPSPSSISTITGSASPTEVVTNSNPQASNSINLSDASEKLFFCVSLPHVVYHQKQWDACWMIGDNGQTYADEKGNHAVAMREETLSRNALPVCKLEDGEVKAMGLEMSTVTGKYFQKPEIGKSNVIALGVGLGVGIPILILILVILYLSFRKYRLNHTSTTSSSSSRKHNPNPFASHTNTSRIDNWPLPLYTANPAPLAYDSDAKFLASSSIAGISFAAPRSPVESMYDGNRELGIEIGIEDGIGGGRESGISNLGVAVAANGWTKEELMMVCLEMIARDQVEKERKEIEGRKKESQEVRN